MSADDEIRLYLQSLLEHKADCQTERCSRCLALDGVLEAVRYRIFSSPVFPDVMIAAPQTLVQKKRRGAVPLERLAGLPAPVLRSEPRP